jgi:uncharacterized protein YuzE
MKIKFSRHAKRRAKLYRISLADIEFLLKNIRLSEGKQEIIKSLEGYTLPVKTVVAVKNDIHGISFKNKEQGMKVYYDNEVDALYINLSNKKPEGVIEISEGVNLDTTSDHKVVGIEILNASKKIDLKTILTYTLEIDKKKALERFV